MGVNAQAYYYGSGCGSFVRAVTETAHIPKLMANCAIALRLDRIMMVGVVITH